MFISGLIYPPLFNLFNGENSEIDDTIQWADEKYDSVCKSSDSAVAILYLREQSVYRSLIVYNNGTPKRYDDPQSLANISDYDSNFPINAIESLKNDGFFIVRTY